MTPIRFLIFIASVFVAPFGGSTENIGRFSLKDFLDRAENNPKSELSVQKAQIEFSKARENLASSFSFFSGTWDVFVGPSPGVQGSDPLLARNNFSNWGPSYGSQISLQIPIYTFGALTAGHEAAQRATEAEESLLGRDRLTLALSVAQIYYGYQLAFELGSLAADLVEKLTEAEQTARKLRSQKTRGAPSALDLEKLSVYLSEARARELEAEKARNQLRAAMYWKIGLEDQGDDPVKWDRANLKARVPFPMPIDRQTLKDFAKKNRPEFFAVSRNMEAKKAIEQAEYSQQLPVVFAGAMARWVDTPHRLDVETPYLYDPLNDLSGAAVLGIRWNFNFFEKNAKYAMARAEATKAEALFRNANLALLADVERAIAEFEFLQKETPVREEGAKRARKLFLDSFVAYTLGTLPAKDLLESMGSFALAQKAYMESVYNGNVAQFRLASAIGIKLDP